MYKKILCSVLPLILIMSLSYKICAEETQATVQTSVSSVSEDIIQTGTETVESTVAKVSETDGTFTFDTEEISETSQTEETEVREIPEEILEKIYENPDIDGNAKLSDISLVGLNKLMYTIAARDGSVFYVIVDLSSDKEDNVYFLNKVDLIDLEALIINDEEHQPKISDVTESIDDTEDNAQVSNTDNEKSKSIPDTVKKKSSNSTMYIIIGIVFIAIIAGYYFLKIRPKKGNKKSDFYDDDDDEIEEEDEEEIYEDISEDTDDDAEANDDYE